MITTQQLPESAPVAAPVRSSAPAAETPVAQKAAIPAKQVKLPARKVSSEITPAEKITVKKTAVKKVATKATPPQKAAAKTPLPKVLVAEKPEKTVASSPKAKKDKLVRDSFTIPKAEYAVINELKQRAAKLERPAKKSELLRAGIKILATLSNAALQAALAQVPTIKTGRPPLKK